MWVQRGGYLHEDTTLCTPRVCGCYTMSSLTHAIPCGMITIIDCPHHLIMGDQKQGKTKEKNDMLKLHHLIKELASINTSYD